MRQDERGETFCRALEKNQHGHRGVSDQKPKLIFEGDLVYLPWAGWEGVAISPAGLHTKRGILSISEIDLLFWKASFYDRGLRGTSRDIMGDFEEKQP